MKINCLQKQSENNIIWNGKRGSGVGEEEYESSDYADTGEEDEDSKVESENREDRVEE